MKIQSIKPWVIGGIVVLVLQILLGGWTTSNYAAFACPDLPACQGQWLPEMDFAEGFNVFQTIGPNYLGGLMESEARVAIHFTHRVGAIVTTIYILGLCSALLRIDAPSIKKVVFLVAGLLALQICLGISNILLMVPLVIAVAHNAVGAFLLLSLVLLATRLWMAQPESGTTPADLSRDPTDRRGRSPHALSDV